MLKIIKAHVMKLSKFFFSCNYSEQITNNNTREYVDPSIIPQCTTRLANLRPGVKF